MAVWTIREDAGKWTVRSGRTVRDFESQDDALKFLDGARKDGDRVRLEESDGYRIPLRPRKHWRR